MARGFTGQLCAYCGIRESTRSGDHVFARAFFLEEQRANLPKVPACVQCNGEKAQLEHYLATVLPFGGRHTDAGANLQQQVPERLAQNARLHRELAAGRETIEIEDGDGQRKTGTTALPFDGEKFLRYAEFLVKGLLFRHWQIVLKPGFGVRVMTPTNAVAGQLITILARNARQRVKGDLGSGTITYEGAQGTDYAEMSVWTISIYAGVVLAEHSHHTDDLSTMLYAVTAKEEFLERPVIVAVFGDRSGSSDVEDPAD